MTHRHAQPSVQGQQEINSAYFSNSPLNPAHSFTFSTIGYQN